MNEKIEAALGYAKLGFHVFPLKANQKIPATPHGHKDATIDFDRIISCWGQRPDLNIGMAMNSSNLVAIDVDSYNVNAGPKLHRTPERKCTIWLDLAGVKLRQLVGFRFVHGPARRSAPTKQRSFAGLWTNRGAVFALQALRDCRLCLRR